MAIQTFGSRGTVIGPATGGLLLQALHQKRAGQAAIRSEDNRHVPVAAYAVAVMYSTTQASMTAMSLLCQAVSMHNSLTTGSRFVLRKGTAAGGPGGITGSDAGWTKSTAVQAVRTMVRSSSGDVSSDTTSILAFRIDDDGTATSAFNGQALVLMACHGHRYDPDNTSMNYPYEAADD